MSETDDLQQKSRLAHQAVSLNEQERERLSNELRSEVTQGLTILRVRLMELRDAFGLDAHPRYMDAITTLNSLMRRVTHMADDLRPPQLAVGLHAELEKLCQETADRTHLNIYYYGEPLSLPEAYNTTIYRFVQQMLSTLDQHAHATRITVSMSLVGDWVSIRIADNGHGIAADEPESASALGLASIAEQLQILNGHLEIDEQTGIGTTLLALLPAPDSMRKSE